MSHRIKSIEKGVRIIWGVDGFRKMGRPAETKSVTRGPERQPWAITEGEMSYTSTHLYTLQGSELP